MRGLEGERIFDEYVNKYVTGDYELIRDYSFEYNTLTQIDAIVVTTTAIYVYEMKNYDAECTLKDGVFHFIGREIFSNPFVQMENIRMRFKGLLHKIGYQSHVFFHVVIINPNCMLKESFDIPNLIMRNELKSHLSTIRQDEVGKFNPSRIRAAIESHSVENRYQASVCTDYKNLRKGFLCYNCGSLNFQISHKKIHCIDCGSTIN